MDGESCGEKVSLVVAFMIGSRQGCPSAFEVKLSVGESLLVDPLVISRKVEGKVAGGQIDAAQTPSCLIAEVCSPSCCLILPEAIHALVECGCRESEAVAEAVIVGCIDLALTIGATVYAEVCALIVHWVVGVQAYQSSLGIHAIECPLGPSQDIDAFQSVGVDVVHALCGEWNAIDVHAQRRASFLGANATDVGRRGVARAVVRHRERGDVETDLSGVIDSQPLQVSG